MRPEVLLALLWLPEDLALARGGVAWHLESARRWRTGMKNLPRVEVQRPMFPWIQDDTLPDLVPKVRRSAFSIALDRLFSLPPPTRIEFTRKPFGFQLFIDY